jgi:glycosyltransferase involved in cell wall biosynthesis
MTPATPATRGALRVLYDFVIFRMERRGGISRYVCELARRLGASGATEALVACGLHDNAFVAELQDAPGVRLLGAAAPTRLARRSLVGALDYGFLRLLGATLRGVDVYHPSYYPRVVRPPRGARVVATVYDMIHERLPEFHHGDPTPARKRALVEAADLVLCISRTTADDLTAIYGVDPSRIRITYLGAASGLVLANSSPAPRGRPYFLYVGRRHGYKNFHRLLEAYVSDAALRADTALVAVGGEEWNADEQRLIAKAGSTAQVVRVKAGDKELTALYRSALALVVPSLYEGFGLPAVEAMRIGCPVVANATGSLPEVIGDAGVVMAMTDFGELATVMSNLAGDEERRRVLGAKGRARASRYDWAATATATAAAYREVVGAR